MALRFVITTLALATLLAAPAGADQRERHRQSDNRNQSEQPSRARDGEPARDRAVPRAQPQREADPPRADLSAQQQRAAEQQRVEAARRADDNRRADNGRDNRRYDNNRDNGRDNRRYDNRSYDNRSYNNGYYNNRGYAYGSRRYDSGHRYYYYYAAPRIVRPVVVQVVPYRPYVYHPSFSLGVYYGSGGYYPYGYTPRYYYEPVPGRPYGGVRITGAPRDARVFADGYFVGIVDDFDGIFQHINLEAGPHHIEVDWGGGQPIAFDVYVRPGETTTFRADRY